MPINMFYINPSIKVQFRCQLIFLKSIYHFNASQNPKYNTFPYIHNEQSIPKNIYIFPKFLKLILGEKKFIIILNWHIHLGI